MTNPTPRPALRKAEDATVHPAAPRPARSPRAAKQAPAPVAAEPAPTPVPEPAPPAAAPAKAAKPGKSGEGRSGEGKAAEGKGGKRKRKFGGATSDHLRVEPEPVPAGVASGTDATLAGPKRSKPGKPAKPATKGAPAREDLMAGKLVDLGVQVPKALRKAAQKRAKAEGLDTRTVVVDLLHAWVTSPPR